MSEGHSSIHDFDLALIGEYFAMLERQGPGNPETTLKALSFVGGLKATARIADIGCGTGAQTLVLAEHTPGHILAIDLFPAFIEKLNANAVKAGLKERVDGQVGNMEALAFEPASLDLIWSEGAIYNIGFERGLREWHKFLKPGGYLAVSEASWFTPERPAEIHDYWMAAYPEIDLISNKVAQMEAAGFVPKAAFTLPESCWTDHYYAPQAAMQAAFLEKHAGNPAAKALVDNERREAALYAKYKPYYGYVFYIGQKG